MGVDVGDSFDTDPAWSGDQTFGDDSGGGGSGEIPMGEPELSSGAPGAVDFSKIDPKLLMAHELEYAAAGKTVKEPLEMILKRAQQGYDYAQKMEAYNRDVESWQQKIKAAESSASRFKDVNEYAEQNPEWAQWLQEQWSARQAQIQGGVAGDPNDPFSQQISQALSPILQKFGTLEERVSSILQEKVANQQKAEDQALDAEVKSIRDQYSNIDFDQRDEFGKSLESRIIEHGLKLGLKGEGAFRAAFRDFYHDKLVSTATDKAKEAEAKKRAELKKQGFIGTTPTPTKGLRPAQSVRNKSYDELAMEGLQELQG